MKRVLLKPPGAESPIELTVEQTTQQPNAYVVRIDGAAVEVESTSRASGIGNLRIAGRMLPYCAVRRGQSLQLWLDGTTYSFELVDGRRGGRSRPAESAAGALGDLLAPMPGTILKVNVSAGDVFSNGDALIVMESMKMEMTLAAPAAGRVAKIACAPGQMVEMGAVLAQLVPV